MIMLKGELATRANKHKIDWPGLVFLAAADKEPFIDVEFVTLSQHCVDLVIPEAIEYCADQNISGDQESLIKAYVLNNNEPMELKEFVNCHYDNYSEKMYVTVGVNVDTINEEAEEYGLELLSQVSRFTSGLYQQFGKSYTFTPAESLR